MNVILSFSSKVKFVEKLNEFCSKKNLSRAEVIRQAIEELIEKEEEKS